VSIAWFRFRATFGRRWGGYLSLILLVGLVGGLALGGLAAARRTQSSFSTYLASTNPSDINFSVFGGVPNGPSAVPGTSLLEEKISRLPHVRGVRLDLVLNGVPLRPDGSPRVEASGLVYPLAGTDGLFFNQDRVVVTEGRMADPTRPNEMMMAASGAQLLGWHVGQTIPYGFYTNEQQRLPQFGTSSVPPKISLKAKLVGLITLNSEIVEDDIDRVPTFAVFTPALARVMLANPNESFSSASTFSIQTKGGSRTTAAVETELSDVIPSGPGFGGGFGLHDTAPVAAKADRAVKPIATALGVFGAVAFLAALLMATQVISRRLREGAEEQSILRALGADPSATMADGLVGILGAVVAGSLAAAVVALAISPIAPLGPIRSVYPAKGISADWTVLGLGLLALIVVLSAIAVVLAYRGAPHRVDRRVRLAPPNTSKFAQRAAAAGLPAPGVVGVRMALESGGGRTAVPVRSALVGTALAVALVVTMTTFGSSLQTLVNHPALYGWNWSYMLNQVGSSGAGVPPQALTILAHDRDVAAATGVNYFDATIDGQNVPFLFGNLHASITPPILSGHALEKVDQIMLGAATMAQLHKRLGDTVTVSYGTPKEAPAYVPPTRLFIVGTATMPAVGFTSIVSDHTSMGTGALVSIDVLPAAFQQTILSPYPTLNGPSLVWVRLRPGVEASVGRADLQRVANAVNKDLAEVPQGAGSGATVVVQGVQRPAEIVNYRTIGDTPALLVAGLALGAAIALALTLAASVRRRRRDLALLKTLGFTQRQLAAAVAWQASVSAVVGAVVGVPVGIVLGRWSWDLFARQISAVPQPTVPPGSLILIALGTFVLANVVAVIPARIAARTSTALMLRAE
jgi:hypothetical protein